MLQPVMFTRNGFSLVELMVALLLGSLIAIAATQLFLVNRQTENLQLGLTAVQDQGRFATDYLKRDLMQAGHNLSGSVQPFVFAGDANKISVDGNKHDTVVFDVRDGVDCVGNASYSGLKKYTVVNTSTSTNGLQCTYWAPATGHQTTGVIIDGVESFQVQYGIDYDTSGMAGHGLADAYTDAAGAKMALEADAKKRIVSVRFAMLLSSPGVVSTDTDFAPGSVQVLDKTFNTGTDSSTVNLQDGRLYRVFGSTATIRNQMDET